METIHSAVCVKKIQVRALQEGGMYPEDVQFAVLPLMQLPSVTTGKVTALEVLMNVKHDAIRSLLCTANLIVADESSKPFLAEQAFEPSWWVPRDSKDADKEDSDDQQGGKLITRLSPFFPPKTGMRSLPQTTFELPNSEDVVLSFDQLSYAPCPVGYQAHLFLVLRFGNVSLKPSSEDQEIQMSMRWTMKLSEDCKLKEVVKVVKQSGFWAVDKKKKSAKKAPRKATKKDHGDD